MIVADTDVLIDFLAVRDPAAAGVEAALERGVLRTTAVTRFELLSGARTPRQRSEILGLLAAAPALPLDDAAADRAAEVRAALDRAGESIGMADCLIAGIVLTNGGALFTRNRRHFERVPGLELAGLP